MNVWFHTRTQSTTKSRVMTLCGTLCPCVKPNLPPHNTSPHSKLQNAKEALAPKKLKDFPLMVLFSEAFW